MIYKVVKGLKNGLREGDLKVISIKEKRKDMGNMNGQMEVVIQDNGATIQLMEKVFISGMMEEHITENGKKTICMV